MCISTGNFDSIFFLWITLFLNFKIWRKWKILLKQLVSATPLKPLNRISWNFVVMKDIMCRYAFLQEMLIWSFWGAIYIPFFLRLPFTNAWNCHSYSILKQCWSVGYVSLLTLSFIYSKVGLLIYRQIWALTIRRESLILRGPLRSIGMRGQEWQRCECYILYKTSCCIFVHNKKEEKKATGPLFWKAFYMIHNFFKYISIIITNL